MGSSGSEEASVTTTDGSDTDLSPALTLEDDTSYVAEAVIVARKSDGTTQVFKKMCGVEKSSGTATILTPGTQTIFESTPSTWDCVFAIDGSDDLVLRATGEANVNWSATITYNKVA